MSTESQTFLPWMTAFKVQFRSKKIGLKFQQTPEPDTGNGVFNVSLLEVTDAKSARGAGGPADYYNSLLRKDQARLRLRPGLLLTHINDDHLTGTPCALVIGRLKSAPRPITLRFVDAQAGTVSLQQVREKERLESGNTLIFDEEMEMSPEMSSPIDLRAASSPTSNITTLSSSLMTKSTGFATEEVYKVILLGAAGVGKSSLLSVCIDGNDSYLERRPATLEPEFGSLSLSHPSLNKVLKIRLWDTAGQERYKAVTQSHYRRADGAIIIYDVADKRSFDSVDTWLTDLKQSAGDSLKTIMLVENKVDMLGAEPEKVGETRSQRFVCEHRVQEYVRNQGLLFARTSARKNATVYKWKGQEIAKVVEQVAFAIHAAKLEDRVAAKPADDSILLQPATEAAPVPTGECASCI